MNRFVRAAAAALVIAGGFGSVGCATRTGNNTGCRYYNWVDPSWPDRYSYAARQSVIAPFGQQVTNGHFQNQVIWNWYFEPGTDKLNGAGMEKLDSIARTTPNPDTKLFVQAPRDLAVTNENMAKIGALRDDLAAKRAVAIQKYMATQPGAAVSYELAMVDMPVPGIYAPFATNSFRGQLRGYQGLITGVSTAANPNIAAGTGLLSQGVPGAVGPSGTSGNAPGVSGAGGPGGGDTGGSSSGSGGF
ncbi:MAG TPA: hypothetical protein VLM40_13690 [Gemmata sp.]|nr:hypothetical protein [Gemmata sp.]